MNINSAFPSDFLKCEDLQKRRRTVTIESVSMEEVGKDNELKPVMRFVSKDKGFVLNKTNAMMCAELLESDNSDDWIGRQIVLRPDMTTFQGKPTPCIRVDSELPNAVEPPRKNQPANAVGRNASAADREWDEDAQQRAETPFDDADEVAF